MAASKKNQADGLLTAWLLEVLKHQAHDATIELPDGTDALVKLEGRRLIAYQYLDEAGEGQGRDKDEVWLSVIEFPVV